MTPTRVEWMAGTIAVITALLGVSLGNACDTTGGDKVPTSPDTSDTGLAESDECEELACTVATAADFQRYKCDECGDE